MRRALYIIAQIVWGAPQTLLGFLLFCACAARGRRHRRYRGAIVTEWRGAMGFSCGPFIFIPRIPDDPARRPSAGSYGQRLLVHEYGHTMQSLLFGPAYLPVMALPSIVWANLPILRNWRKRRGVSYFSFYTERLANYLGERATGEPSMRVP